MTSLAATQEEMRKLTLDTPQKEISELPLDPSQKTINNPVTPLSCQHCLPWEVGLGCFMSVVLFCTVRELLGSSASLRCLRENVTGDMKS